MTLQKITLDMPEPEGFGSFLVWEDSDNLECLLTHLAENDAPWIDAEAEWGWPDIQITYLGYEIESLDSFKRRMRGQLLDVTDAAADAAAKALMSYATNWARTPTAQSDIDRMWVSMPEEFCENFRRQAKAALQAAVKAVTA